MWWLNSVPVPPPPLRACLCAPSGLAACRCHQIASDWGWSHRSPLLVFHVGYISDRRVIKAAINAWPFPLPLSYRPTGQDCASTGLMYTVCVRESEWGGGVMDFPHFLWLWTWKKEKNHKDAADGKSSDLLRALIHRLKGLSVYHHKLKSEMFNTAAHLRPRLTVF